MDQIFILDSSMWNKNGKYKIKQYQTYMYIKIENLIEKYNIKINGVLHLGAHKAEEALDYQKVNASKVIWIEGNPELMPYLETELKKYPNQFVYNVLISDVDDKEVNFNITNNLQSSSILELGTHSSHHPNVKVDHISSLKTHRLDTFFAKNNINISDCNFLNIDLQGAEMMALNGLGDNLKYFKYIYTEVNIGSVYKNCPLLFNLDKYLQDQGFIRAETYMTPWQWGDAFYIRQNSSFIRRKWNLFYSLCLQYMYPLKNILGRSYNFIKSKTNYLFGKLIKKHTVTIQLRGGLGNQMFQYAFGKYISTKNNNDLSFDLTTLLYRNDDKSVPFRDYDLEIFSIKPQLTFLSYIENSISKRGRVISTIFSKINYSYIKIINYFNNNYIFDEKKDLDFLSDNMYVVGYWQNCKYVLAMEKELRNDFLFKEPILPASKHILDGIQNSESVCVHVRRSDFIRNSNFVGINYYKNAYEKILSLKKDVKFFIFSDDIGWCKDSLHFIENATFINNAHNGYKSSNYLHLMSNCSHFIIPNSTFAWWAAWLGEKKNKIVIAPKKWIQGNTELMNIVPDNWIRI